MSKVYALIAVAASILGVLLLVFVFLVTRNTTTNPALNESSTLVSPVPPTVTPVMFQNTAPTIFITPFQGSEFDPRTTPEAPESLGGDPPLSTEQRLAAEQREHLINNIPVKNDGFTVTYDYEEAMFAVQFDGSTGRRAFEEWLQQNYPNIEPQEFIIR